jgi:hypothetical protein
VHPLVGELIDGGAPRVAGMVAHAEGEEHKHRSPVGLELEHKDHPEATVGRRQIDLSTVWKDGVVVAVLGNAA